ncbi:hypothetical protein DL95DRAFT_452559 [Leptodontidium sp. 2 PMI_412]|nr:hypothetical protein BKA61DRAFT_578633 [Leptodontidium sp. MPI-SDFR-AT-0119]KAH9224826.1 hypothetical protein DL95DRAFT_452559 [Leptodontidium sp. 2 PMI_412]
MSASRKSQELDTPNRSRSSHRIQVASLNGTHITSPKFCSGSNCSCCNSAHTSSSGGYSSATGRLDQAKHVTKQSESGSESTLNTNYRRCLRMNKCTSDFNVTESNAASDIQSLGNDTTYSTDTHEEYPGPLLYSQATAKDISFDIHGVGDWVNDHTLRYPAWHLPPTAGNATFPELSIGSASFITLVERAPRRVSCGSRFFRVDSISNIARS